MWKQLGWFSGLVCAGSVAGAVAWGANMPNLAFYYEAFAPDVTVTTQQAYALNALSDRWYSLFYIMYPVEFLCLIMAKVMLLGRMSNHASHNYNSQEWHLDDGVGACHCIGEYALAKLHRAISTAVALASVAGVLAMVVAAVYQMEVAKGYDQAAAACDAQGNDTNSSIALRNDAINLITTADDAIAVQAVLEATVLVVMSAAYTVFIPVCVSMFGRAERRLIRILGQIEHKLDHSVVLLPAQYNPQAAHGAAAGAEIRMRCDKAKELLRSTLAEATAQRRRFVGACSIVLLTFLLRASFDLLYAYSNVDNQYNPLCGLCDPCQSDKRLIRIWLDYTPEFQAVVVALSSPLPLAVSLWLMMTKEDRMLLLLLVFPATNENANLLPEQNRETISLQLVNSAANENAQTLPERNMLLASRQNMAIDLL
jgi:hypothetical protein